MRKHWTYQGAETHEGRKFYVYTQAQNPQEHPTIKRVLVPVAEFWRQPVPAAWVPTGAPVHTISRGAW